MMKIRLKNEKGAISSDAFIAILIIVISVGLIATLVYNIYISTTETKRKSQATSYIVEIFEYINKIYYGDVTEENIVEYVGYKYNNAENAGEDEERADINIASARNVTNIEDTSDTKDILTTPYKIEVSIEPHNLEFDLVKTITITVKYNVANEEKSLTMEKIKARENLITPNAPNISQLEVAEGEKIYPIKYKENNWYVTNSEVDTAWYNYQNGYWATVLVTEIYLDEGERIPIDVMGDYYIWIPKYAYNNSNNLDTAFIYKDTNCYVNAEGNLEEIDENTATIVEGRMAQYI